MVLMRAEGLRLLLALGCLVVTALLLALLVQDSGEPGGYSSDGRMAVVDEVAS